MTETLEKKLIANFSAAWNETAPGMLNESSTISLLALREVGGDDVAGALAVAVTWSSAYAAPCKEGIPGVLVCLFKEEDETEFNRLIKQRTDGKPKPGVRALVKATLSETAQRLAAEQVVTFGDAVFFDLTADESRLAKIVGDAAWVGTFSLTVGDQLNTQAIVLYAPHGSLEIANTTTQDSAAVNQPTATNVGTPQSNAATAQTAPQPTATRRNPLRREEPRNFERLLDVELNVIVRFGVTNVPLREVVRMGVGTMIELNRAVDEPVELLVNGRLLARGEVVVVDGYYGVRITEIGAASERALSLA